MGLSKRMFHLLMLCKAYTLNRCEIKGLPLMNYISNKEDYSTGFTVFPCYQSGNRTCEIKFQNLPECIIL